MLRGSLVWHFFKLSLIVLVCYHIGALTNSAESRMPRGSIPLAISNNGGMLLGLAKPTYYNGNPVFLNWAQGAGGQEAYGIFKISGGQYSNVEAYATGVIDANSELIAGAGLSNVLKIRRGIFTPPPNYTLIPSLNSSPWWNGLAMKITWTGSATVAQSGTLGTGSTALSCGANSCTFTFGSDPSNAAFDFTLTNVNDPPKNIFIHEVRYQTEVTALATCTPNVNCNHFRPEFINAVRSFGRIRTMDWMEVNAGGPPEISQMADFNYQNCISCSYGGTAVAFSSSISGTTMTVVTPSTGSFGIGVGLNVFNNIATVTAGTTIVGDATRNSGLCTPACTGSGSAGTYAVNNSQTVASSSLYFVPNSAYAGISGPKGGVHPSVVIELARITGADIYFPVPVSISDTGMTAVATYFRDNLPPGIKVFFEIGNEDWNSGLGVNYFWLNAAGQAQGLGTNGLKLAGYRMAQLALIASNVFGTDAYSVQAGNTTARWGAMLEGQMTSDTSTSSTPGVQIQGFVQWQADTGSTKNISNLFSEIVVAPYFSDFPSTITISAVTPGTTTTVQTSGNHLFSPGQVKRLFFGNTGGGTVGSVLNNQNVTLATASTNTFTFSTINTTGLTYSSAGSSDYVADGPLMNMADASNTCFGASAASATGTLTGTALSLSGVSGTIVPGMSVSGTGFPANTYLNSGSGTSWVTNNSGAAGPVAVTFTPCATKFQFFSQQWAKLMITNSNDYGYAGPGLLTLPSWTTIFAKYALLANSYKLALGQYEGGSQFLPSLQYNNNANALKDQAINWQWDAAGNDPTYTAAKVYAASFQLFRDVNSAYSAKFEDVTPGGNWYTSGLRYFGDSNPSWSAILAENALGPYVQPATPNTWTATYAGNGTNRYFSATGCSGCTDTLSTTVLGTAATRAIMVATLSGGTITNATCDGVSGTQNAFSNGDASRSTYIFSFALSAGTNVRTCTITTSGASSQNREFYVMKADGLTNGFLNAQTGNPSGTMTVNYTKNALIVTGAACASSSYANTSGVSTPSVSSPATTTIASDADTTSTTAKFAMFKAPFSSSIFSVAPGCNNSSASAVYN